MLAQPGLAAALELVAAEGIGTVYTGTIAERLLAVAGNPHHSADLGRYEARWNKPVGTGYTGTRFLTRGGLAGVSDVLSRLPRLRALSERERVHVLLGALDGGPELDGDTTNLVTADGEGRACVLTTSLGLGTGDFLPGLDLHLNSMLGEVDLVRSPLEPGERMASMMAPSLALGDDGVVLAIGSAGGTRLRTALVGVAAGILDEGLDPPGGGATALPPRRRRGQRRAWCRRGALVDLEQSGLRVRRWPAQHHYFGGVSLIAAAGGAADPRRSGHAVTLR